MVIINKSWDDSLDVERADIDEKSVPSRWKKDLGINQFTLKIDTIENPARREGRQPFVVFTKHYGKYNSNTKRGFQCKFGHFAGNSCHVAPLRSTEKESARDCHEFMNKFSDRDQLSTMLGKCYVKENVDYPDVPEEMYFVD